MNPSNKSFTTSLAFLASLRLMLLIAPEVLAVKLLGHAPVVCVIVCVSVLAIWLSVDVGPFRAVSTKTAPSAKPARTQAPRLAKLENLSYFFCKVIMFAAMFQSRLAHWH